ncbi:hypothetical protein ALC62_14413 [Cyphomyrmex costatus]|uniref:Uncharacterized protein n=1 Tax=Cyphomyrmex costatus TaxID=456900 RepID=A0A195C3R6_9HYME|nr:hypothetical protein ALC62_14413 [Cyphomyrmex costatus]
MTSARAWRLVIYLLVYTSYNNLFRPPTSFQYNLDFRGLSARGAGGSPYRGGEGGGADGDGGGVGVDGSKTGSAPGSDPSV